MGEKSNNDQQYLRLQVVAIRRRAVVISTTETKTKGLGNELVRNLSSGNLHLLLPHIVLLVVFGK